MSIEEIGQAHPNLFLEHHIAMAAALMPRISAPPCDFRVECHGLQLSPIRTEGEFVLRVGWSAESRVKGERILRTEQIRPCIEHAAIAVACLLFAKFVPDARLEATKYGERADYWLTNLGSALEVSGTLSSPALPKRVVQKTRQLLGNPEARSGFVVAVSFEPGRPMIHWSYHRQEQP